MSNMQRRLLPSTGALAAFDSVARLGSFSAAATELSLTQGAVSRQIALLEEQLGVRLFHRNGRGVELTVLDDPGCIALMARFMREQPALWNEDIGE